MNEFLTQLANFFGGSDESRIFTTSDGFLLTLALALIPLTIGLVCSIPLAFARNAKNRFIAGTVWLYTYLFRGTPMLVQLFLIYYGLAQFDFIKDGWAWQYLRDPYCCALITFTLNTTAYTTEILAGQIRRIDWREIEAAQSLGMSHWQMNYRIVLPSALRRSLPAYSNEVIMLLHGTAIVSLVTLNDVTGIARHIYSDTYNPFQPFLIAGAIYLVLTWSITRVFMKMEDRWLAFLKPQLRDIK